MDAVASAGADGGANASAGARACAMQALAIHAMADLCVDGIRLRLIAYGAAPTKGTIFDEEIRVVRRGIVWARSNVI